jgi:hypothetical protein
MHMGRAAHALEAVRGTRAQAARGAQPSSGGAASNSGATLKRWIQQL